jgi:hypothetical protein
MLRMILVLVAAATVVLTSSASAASAASDRDCAREAQSQSIEAQTQVETTECEASSHPAQPQAAAPRTLAEVFATPTGQSIETEDGVSAEVGPLEVVISRIGKDGKPIMACVDSPEAAKRFFDAPLDKLHVKQGKEH